MGRKKMKANEKFDIRLRVDEALHQRIQAAADRQGNSVAAYIRAAVVKDLDQNEREKTK